MMRAMKDSGIEWIGQISADWEVQRIKRIGIVYSGSTPKSSNPSFWDGDIVWVTPADYKTNDVFISDSKKKITKAGYNSCGTTIVPTDSILISNRAPIGNIIISGCELCTNQGCKSFCLNDNANVKYYYYYLSVMDSPLNMLGRGTTFMELSTFDFMNFSVVFPPLPVQQRIADYLDDKCCKIDAYVDRQHQIIDKLTAYKQSVITEAVTKGLDPTVPMKDSGVEWIGKIPEHWCIAPVTKMLESLVDYRGKTPQKVDDGIFLVTAKNIKSGRINYDLSHEYVSEVDYDDIMHRGLPQIGDVLFTTEAPLGEVACVDNTDIALAQRVIKFRGRPDILNNYYLKYWFMSTGFQNFLHSLSTGSTAAGIKASKLFMLLIALCGFDEQQQIVDYLDRKCAVIDEAISKKLALIDRIDAYKKSLIYEVVTGKKEV